jgi:hypothetical protein
MYNLQFYKRDRCRYYPGQRYTTCGRETIDNQTRDALPILPRSLRIKAAIFRELAIRTTSTLTNHINFFVYTKNSYALTYANDTVSSRIGLQHILYFYHAEVVWIKYLITPQMAL